MIFTRDDHNDNSSDDDNSWNDNDDDEWSENNDGDADDYDNDDLLVTTDFLVSIPSELLGHSLLSSSDRHSLFPVFPKPHLLPHIFMKIKTKSNTIFKMGW